MNFDDETITSLNRTSIHQHDNRFTKRMDGSAPLMVDVDGNETTRRNQASPFSFCCPCLFLCIDGPLLCCDWSACEFWKIVPAFFASNAFSCSITILTVCHLVHRHVDMESNTTTASDQSHNSQTTNDSLLSLGFWSYAITANVNTDNSSTIFNHESPDIPIDSCQSYEITDPITSIIFSDIYFHIARGLAVGTMCLGFGTMAALWIGMLRDSTRRHRGVSLRPNSCHWSRGVALTLWVCAALQMTSFWLLQHGSILCKHMDCHWGRGSSIVVAASIQYILTGILMCWWPRNYDTYSHGTIANDETQDVDYDHPEEVAEIDEGGWGSLWNDLSSEQVELIELSDNSTMLPHHETTVFPKSNPIRRSDPSPVSSSSLWMVDLESECQVPPSTTIVNQTPTIPKYPLSKATISSQQLSYSSKLSSRRIPSESSSLELGTRNNLRDILNHDPIISTSDRNRPNASGARQSSAGKIMRMKSPSS
jgi:hypothetical protein